MEKKLLIDKLMENLKTEIKKVFPRYPYLRRFFLFGNWRILFSIRRKILEILRKPILNYFLNLF